MQIIRTFPAALGVCALFAGCNEPERGTVPSAIANTVWGNFTEQIGAYQQLSFSAGECPLEVIPREDYDRFQEGGGSCKLAEVALHLHQAPVEAYSARRERRDLVRGNYGRQKCEIAPYAP